MPGRQTTGSQYRYGFNDKEKDDEIKGSGNSYDFGDRIFDPRIGRFFSLDRRMSETPFLSPYSFAGNNPIRWVDIDGEKVGDPPSYDKDKKGNITVKFTYKNVEYTIQYNQKRPQEFNVSNGTDNIDFNFYTEHKKSGKKDEYRNDKSMGLSKMQSKEVEILANNPDYQKLQKSKLGKELVRDILVEGTKAVDQFEIGIIGNAALPEFKDASGNVTGYQTTEGKINPDQFDDFSKQRAQQVKGHYFQNAEGVDVYSRDEGEKANFKGIDVQPRNRDKFGIKIFLKEKTTESKPSF